ncbi:hypothetical protein HRbin13_00500 [bacterium HR13]|nr:hypothetical protein HRbin13_00500 [bacterium HR13]
MPLAIMIWGKEEREHFYPEKILWLVDNPHPHWIETVRDNLKMDFKETGFRQFITLSSRYIITDAMLMFGLQFCSSKEKLLEALNPIRLMVKVKPGSFLGMSHHFLGAPFEVECDEVLREFLMSARRELEDGGFGLDVLIISHSPYIEDLLLCNLDRIKGLRFRFYSTGT